MKTEGYSSAQAARTALVEAGFQQGFSSPGRPTLWIRGKERCAVALASHIDGVGEWRIVSYPEPSVANPQRARELAERDQIFTDQPPETGAEDLV